MNLNEEFKFMGISAYGSAEVEEKSVMLTPIAENSITENYDRRYGKSQVNVAPEVIFSTFYLRINVGPEMGLVESDPVIIQGKRCHLRLYKSRTNDTEYLSIFLVLSEDDMRVDVSRAVDWNITLVSTVRSYSEKIPTFQWDWRWPRSYGYLNFIQWQDLHNSNNGFVKGEHALLKIDLGISDPIKIEYH